MSDVTMPDEYLSPTMCRLRLAQLIDGNGWPKDVPAWDTKAARFLHDYKDLLDAALISDADTAQNVEHWYRQIYDCISLTPREETVINGMTCTMDGGFKVDAPRLMQVIGEIHKGGVDLAEVREILKKIGKPALGGKQQQQWANEALHLLDAQPSPVATDKDGMDKVRDAIAAWADKIEHLGFSIPAPNTVTPELVQLAIHMRHSVQSLTFLDQQKPATPEMSDADIDAVIDATKECGPILYYEEHRPALRVLSRNIIKAVK